MPSPPYATLRVSLNGGAITTGGIAAAVGQSCQVSADPAGVSGASTRRFEIYGFPSTFATPGGWTLSNGVMSYTGSTPPAFTLSVWGKYMLRLVLNNGISTVASIPSTQLTDEATAISVPSPSGLVDVGTAETTQFSGQGWVAADQANLRSLEAAIGTTATAKALSAAKAASTANVASLSSGTTLDGIAVTTGDTVLLKNQSTGSQNGPWVVNGSGAWTRPSDFDSSGKIFSGQTIVVTQGSTQAGTQWALVTAGPFTLGTTSLTWQQISGSGGGGTSTTIQPVKVVSTSNLTLSGTQTVDGVALIAGDRIAVIGQTLAKNNGIYVVASGSWSRASDYTTATQIQASAGQTFLITSGTLGANRLCMLTTTGTIVVGTTDLIFQITLNPGALSDALKFLRKNSAGSDLEYVDINSVVTTGAKARVVLLTSVSHSGVPASYDGVTLSSGDIVLDAYQTGATKGLWVLAAGSWTRPTTITQGPGLIVAVTEGAHGAGTQWQLNGAAPFTLDTTSQAWVRTDGGGQQRSLTTSSKTTTAFFNYPVPRSARAALELTFHATCATAAVTSTRQQYNLIVSSDSSGVVTVDPPLVTEIVHLLGGPTFGTTTGAVTVTWSSAFTATTQVLADAHLTELG